MPQMSPMSWIFIYMIFFFSLLLVLNLLPRLEGPFVFSHKSSIKTKTIKW